MVGLALSLSSMVAATTSVPSSNMCWIQARCRLLLRVAEGLHGIIVVAGERATQGLPRPTPLSSSPSGLRAAAKAGEICQLTNPPTTTTAGGNGQASKLSIRMSVNSRQITRCYRGIHQGLWGSAWLFIPSAGQSVPSASFEYHQEPPASHLLLSLLTPHNPAALTVVPRDFRNGQ